MPATLVMEFVKAIPRIVARESIQGSMVIKVGSGWMEKAAQQRIVSQWNRAAAGEESTLARKSERITSQQAAAMGMEIIITDG